MTSSPPVRRCCALTILAAGMFFGCSPSSDGPLPGSGTGGQAPTGSGGNGSGGAVASGGIEGLGGTGGSNGSGGKGSGGAVGSGGTTIGSGGGVGSGGAIGSGGRSSGGAVGSGGVATGSGGRGSGNTGGRAAGGTQGSGGSGAGNTGGAPNACAATPPLTGGMQHCSSNAQGNVGSYSWTIWSSGTGGCITPYGVDAAFKATWNNSNDFLSRVGLSLGSNKTYDKFGTLSADYAETKTGSGGGYSYIGIYGWSVNPLHEYYIVDDWFGSRPSFAGDKVGSLTADGGTYDILTHTQNNQPAISGGNATFVQFWSLRTVARQCGHISISEHFKAWANAGLVLGNMEEAKILVEVGGGSGSIDFSAATVTAK